MSSSQDLLRPGHLPKRRGPGRRASRPPLFEALEARLVLSHFYSVTSFGDGTDSAVHGGAGTQASPYQITTLRGAVKATNTDPGSTITLPAGTYTLSLAGHSDNNTAGQVSVTAGVTIRGAGSGTTIIQAGTTAANGIDKIFSFNPGGNVAGFPVSLTGLTLRNGRNQQTDFSAGEYFGGAFDFDAGFGGNFNGQGSLTLNDVVVTQNSTVDGDGGGIALFDGGTISITNSQFTNNTSNSQAGRGVGGGAIYFESNDGHATSVTITNSTFDHNTVNGAGGSDPGGAIASTLAGATAATTVLTISGSTITNNSTTGEGGGVALFGQGAFSIQNSTISHNSATNGTSGTGGGVFFSGSTLAVTNSTIDGNSAAGTTAGGNNGGGGGVYAGSGTITVTDSRIVGNTAAIGGSAADANPGQGTAVVANNWFGTNSPPASLFGSTGVTHTPYLVMTFASSKTTLNPGDTATLTASITTNSNGQAGFHVPDGTTTATFAGTHGTVNPASKTLTAGTASSAYTPTAGYSGPAAVSATIDSQTLSIPVTINQPPTITTNPVSQTVGVGQTATFTAAASGSPAPTVQWQVSTNGGSTFGNVAGATSTTLTFTATAAQNGNEYRAVFTNAAGSATTTAATLTVVSAPTANAQAVAVSQDTAKAITLTGSDPNSPPRSLTYIVTANPAHGTLSGTAPNLTYTPAAGYTGPDSFKFKDNNGYLDSNVATVTITVSATNHAPTANDQSVTTNQDTSKAITLTATDPDAGDTLTYTVTTNPAHGTLSGTAPNLTYTPTAGYFGPDSFKFKATDNHGADSNFATVSINVSRVPATVTAVSASWGTAGTAALQTAADGVRLLPAGRNTDLPWLGISQLTITLSAAETLAAADVTVTGVTVGNYGPVSVAGSGTSFTITLAQPINLADRVTVTIGNAGVVTYTRRLDVLPGDVSDDGVVNSQDAVLVRNAYLGYSNAVPTVIDDINGDGVVDVTDYNLVRRRNGTILP